MRPRLRRATRFAAAVRRLAPLSLAAGGLASLGGRKAARAFALVVPLALAGCGNFDLPTLGKGSAASGAPARSLLPKPPALQPVAGGVVVVAAPEGYCIDERASKTGRAPFVLLASCAAISQAAEHPAPGFKGLLTATVGAEGSGTEPINPDLLGGYFRSAKGRAALANSGQAADVSVLDTQVRGPAFLLALRDAGPPKRPELGQARWRGFFTANGRMVTVVLHSLEAEPIATEAGLGLLERFVERITRESAR